MFEQGFPGIVFVEDPVLQRVGMEAVAKGLPEEFLTASSEDDFGGL